jgi:hypothetical protein
MTLSEARQQVGRAFVKPAYDKSFDARVYEVGAELPTGEAFPDAMPVLVAEPVSWLVEFRCFIIDRSVATFSLYLRNGQLDESWAASSDETDQATAFLDRLLNDSAVDLAPAFVMDIGKIEGRDWAVVEANPAWASGIYGCDPARVLPVIQHACVKQEDLAEKDHRWVNERLV